MIPQWMIAHLVLERREDILAKIQEVERGTPGFNVIVIKKEGFSESDQVHNGIVDYFRSKNVLVYNLETEMYKLYKSLECEHNPFEMGGNHSILGLDEFFTEE